MDDGIDIIKISLGDYEHYEELLFMKERLVKEADDILLEYTRLFGKKNIELFKLRIECIELKKRISYCVAAINRGEKPDIEAINVLISAEMLGYKNELELLKLQQHVAASSRHVSAYEVQRVKKIYRDIAKLIHPDINPATAGDEELKDIWEKVQSAYQRNDLDTLEDLSVMVNKILRDKGLDHSKIMVDDLDEKIRRLEERIEDIVTHEPYTYLELINDDGKIEKKNEELDKQISEYTEYRYSLKKQYEEIKGDGN